MVNQPLQWPVFGAVPFSYSFILWSCTAEQNDCGLCLLFLLNKGYSMTLSFSTAASCTFADCRQCQMSILLTFYNSDVRCQMSYVHWPFASTINFASLWHIFELHKRLLNHLPPYCPVMTHFYHANQFSNFVSIYEEKTLQPKKVVLFTSPNEWRNYNQKFIVCWLEIALLQHRCLSFSLHPFHNFETFQKGILSMHLTNLFHAHCFLATYHCLVALADIEIWQGPLLC